MGQVVNGIFLEKALRANFMTAYEAAPLPPIMGSALLVNSDAASEKFGWLGNAPIMQEFRDEKAPKGLLDYNFSIVNKPFEGTIKVDKFALRNDQMGSSGIQQRINDLAVRARLFPAKLMLQLLANGTTQLCYDGQPFFSASHTSGASGAQSNLLTGTGTTLAQLLADFNSAMVLMQGYVDDQGEPWYEDAANMDLMVICSPALGPVFKQLFQTTLINNTTNTVAGGAKVMVSARLTGNSWYLVNNAGAMKPFVLQENMPVTFGSLEGNSDEGFKRRFYLYGVEWYGNVGYGLWQKSLKVVNS